MYRDVQTVYRHMRFVRMTVYMYEDRHVRNETSRFIHVPCGISRTKARLGERSIWQAVLCALDHLCAQDDMFMLNWQLACTSAAAEATVRIVR